MRDGVEGDGDMMKGMGDRVPRAPKSTQEHPRVPKSAQEHQSTQEPQERPRVPKRTQVRPTAPRPKLAPTDGMAPPKIRRSLHPNSQRVLSAWPVSVTPFLGVVATAGLGSPGVVSCKLGRFGPGFTAHYNYKAMRTIFFLSRLVVTYPPFLGVVATAGLGGGRNDWMGDQ